MTMCLLDDVLRERGLAIRRVYVRSMKELSHIPLSPEPDGLFGFWLPRPCADVLVDPELAGNTARCVDGHGAETIVRIREEP